MWVKATVHDILTYQEPGQRKKANAKRGLACCPQDSYKQLAGNGFKFTDLCSLTMISS